MNVPVDPFRRAVLLSLAALAIVFGVAAAGGDEPAPNEPSVVPDLPPALRVAEIRIRETASGDGCGTLHPGALASVTLSLENVGMSDLPSFRGHLVIEDPRHAGAFTSAADWPPLAFGGTAAPSLLPFVVRVAVDHPPGTPIACSFVVLAHDGETRIPIELPVEAEDPDAAREPGAVSIAVEVELASHRLRPGETVPARIRYENRGPNAARFQGRLSFHLPDGTTRFRTPGECHELAPGESVVEVVPITVPRASAPQSLGRSIHVFVLAFDPENGAFGVGSDYLVLRDGNATL